MKYTYACWAVLALSSVALGVVPESWEHATEADFVEGEQEATVVTSLGEIRLSRRLEVLLGSDSAPAVVSALAVHDGVTYVASGTESVIYRLSDGKAEVFAEPPGTMITALTATEDGLLAGTGGEDAGLYAVNSRGAVDKLWSHDDVKYVWDILATRGGRIYLATGPGGRVYSLDGESEAMVVYEAGDLADNILCLARREDRLLAGTDKNGLVVEIDLARKTSRVLLDADEAEVSAIIADAAGGVYVATSDVSRSAGDRAAPSDRDVGRADAPAEQAPPEAVPVEPEPAGQEEDEGDDAADDNDDEEGDESSVPAERGEQGELVAPEPADPQSTAEGMPEADSSDTQQPEEGEQPTTRPAHEQADADGGGQQSAPQPAQEGEQPPQAPQPPSGPPARARPGPTRPGGNGNAVYYIDSDGLVREVFRRGVSIYAMVRDGDRLLLGTGGDGVIYSVTLDGDETAQIADTEASEVVAMMRTDDGGIVFGTANKGSVCELSSEAAEKGTYTSTVLDAGQIARWGTVDVRTTGPAGAAVTVATRSGNVSEPDEATWSDWSDDRPVAGGFLPIESPAGRFLQYRLTLKAVGGRSPAVRRVEIIRQVANLPPYVSAVETEATAGGQNRGQGSEGPLHFRGIKVEASDPNGDRLVLHVQFRQVGEDLWIDLAEDLPQPAYVWDTRGVADGTYELRVTVSDSPSNPPDSARESSRISSPVVVDNTAPVVGELSADVADGVVTVQGRAADAGSRIGQIHYSVDSASEWTAVLPADGICDSREETFVFELSDLEAGAHRIAVRVTDVLGNTGYGNLSVSVPSEAR
ncbi:MAG: hypothetical protein ACP5HU_10710 [Phycisphaerae bacterium]